MNASTPCAPGCAATPCRRLSNRTGTNGRDERHAMTAPLKHSDPSPSMSRSAIAPMTSSSAAACCSRWARASPRCGRACAPRSSPTAPSPNIGWSRREASLAAAGIPTSHVVVEEGEGSKSYAGLEKVSRGADRGEDRAQRSRHRARRRRDRRSRRLCRGDRAPRRRFRAGADLAAGAGRFLRRRQDRHQLAARQEPARRVSSAGAGGRRHRRAGHAVAAPVPRRLCRSRQIRRARRRSLLRLARGQPRRASFPAARRASTRSPPRAAPRLRSSRATSARPASARCSISATPSAMRWRPRPAFPIACSMARALPSAWCWRRNFPPSSA